MLLILLAIILSNCDTAANLPEQELISRNIILIIGDGMGFEQVKASSYYKTGLEGSLSFEAFPYRTQMSTHSSNSSVTDSAASATAMATGRKVNNGVLSLSLPGSGSPLTTLLEIAAAEGKATGLVTTAYITHATPAAFASHVADRGMKGEIAFQYMSQTRPYILLGGGSSFLPEETARQNGYESASTKAELDSLSTTDYLFGYFGEGHMPYMYDGIGTLPELSDMALKALDILEEDEEGFFLMIEAGRIDHAGHNNDLVRLIYETLELSDTVEKVLEWAGDREDTTIIVTADHETGGLQVTGNRGAGIIPEHYWTTTGHTGSDVPVYIRGPYSRELSQLIDDNTDIFHGLVRELP